MIVTSCDVLYKYLLSVVNDIFRKVKRPSHFGNLSVPSRPAKFTDSPPTSYWLPSRLANVSRFEDRNLNRTYITRDAIFPSPNKPTPWKSLYHSRNNRSYLTSLDFDVTSFDVILVPFLAIWNTTSIPRADVNPLSLPRAGAKRLDAAGGLGLILQWLRSSMREKNLS